MKLRNKKTGRIVNFRHIAFDEPKDDRENYSYSSLAAFNDEWEDVKEPLIKDEKIRKAVRAWAEAIEANEVVISYSRHDILKIIDTNADSDICFDYELGYTYNEDTYTIAELCGEEE